LSQISEDAVLILIAFMSIKSRNLQSNRVKYHICGEKLGGNFLNVQN